ncbi:MAG TPA: divalent metal cation transporter, partial [Bryobacteraceae bacterium]|nr:divalent metal cation transporter [Bryobacteraceae bacterium]
CRYNLFDSALALNGALFVNAAILIMAAAVFFTRHIVVTEIQQAHQLLTPLLGTTAASVLFGTALLCSGQSSTLTGTMAGQIVMEGFLHFRIQPWLRRAITRFLAITPAALTIYFAGEAGSYQLLILSQVVLSLQLPFAVIPLVHLTSDRKRMGEFANGLWLKTGAWFCAAFILALNVWLLWNQASDWTAQSGVHRPLIFTSIAIAALGFSVLLGYVMFWPIIRQFPTRTERVAIAVEGPAAPTWVPRSYSTILVPLDHSESDQDAMGDALSLAKLHNARIVLLHVEEGVTSQLFGSQSSTAEIAEGKQYLDDIVESLQAQKVSVDVVVRHGNRPAKEIAAAVAEVQPDLVVMASHGHRGIKDLVFGTTINAVRHRIRVPILIVSGGHRK